ncbi:integrase [Pseudomonas sp. 2995-1]|nr:integrase [Pseudomonas sp. 2995-1]
MRSKADLRDDFSNPETHASALLATGIASIDWIAEQMGYSNGNMIRQHYGTLIDEDGPDVVGILQLALKLSPVTALH